MHTIDVPIHAVFQGDRIVRKGGRLEIIVDSIHNADPWPLGQTYRVVTMDAETCELRTYLYPGDQILKKVFGDAAAA